MEFAMENLINITPEALEYLKSAIQDHAGVRIDIKPGGCSGMTYELNFVDEEKDSDLIFEKDGLTMYIASRAVIYIAGMTVSYVQNAMGGSIVFENPNAKSTCSCGKSFCIDDINSCAGCC